MSIEATHTVDDIMRRWPVTIRVFLIHRMRCIGCPIACFHTVEDACREHGADCRRFLADLRAAVDGTLVRATEVISRERRNAMASRVRPGDRPRQAQTACAVRG